MRPPGAEKGHSAELEEKQIIDKLWDTYELTRSDRAGRPVPRSNRAAAAQRRIAELKRKLGRSGHAEPRRRSKNLTAVNERYQYLSEQRDDVVTREERARWLSSRTSRPR